MTVDGITVFADHADPNQFWYLPGPVQLARRPQDNQAAFTFIKYGDVEGENVVGRGFLMFEVNLRLTPDLERKILSRLSSIAPDRPRLAAVPFDDGSVECIALDLQGGGGTVAQVTDQGTFQAVEAILGTSVPSLHGDNSAAFSLRLSQAGAVILENVFKDKGQPIGVVYSLKYSGLLPALHVEIKANLKRVYDHFSANLEAQYYFIRAGIDAGFEKLKQEGVITINVINFSTAADRQIKEDWALNFFKEMLLADWFKPTLTPGQLAGGLAQAENLDTVRTRADKLRPPQTPTPPQPGNGTPPGGTNPGGGTPGGTNPGGGTPGGTNPGGGTPGGTNPGGGTPGGGTPGGTTPGGNTPPVTPPITTPVDRGSGAPEQPTRVTNPPATTNPAAAATAATGMPPQSSPAAPVQQAGLNFTPSTAPSPANIQADSAVVSFKLKFIKQIEDKELTFEFNRSEAVQRLYPAQGFFGLLAQDLSREGHFFEVDGDDPFFREFRVSVETPFDKKRIGLASAHVKLQYGKPGSPDRKFKDFVIDETSPEKLDWLVKMTPGMLDYSQQIQFHFDPDSDWIGEQQSYELPEVMTEDRTLLVHPFDHLGFLEIEVSPSLVDWTVVSSVDVHLAYTSPTGWNPKETFSFAQDRNAVQTWKLRLSDAEARAFTYHCEYRLRDGSVQTMEPVTGETTKIAVPNPFYVIAVDFVPLFDTNLIRMVFIDIEYDDPDNELQVRERLRLTTETEPVKFRLNVEDPKKRLFRYRFTFVGKDNSLQMGEFVETSETLIGVVGA